MSNEMLLIVSIFIYFGLLIVFYKLFSYIGLYIWVAIATILANIEVIMLIDAFGVEMTLGNVCFASIFLATDLLSEKYSKKHAKQAVIIGALTSIAFIVSSQVWLNFKPSTNDLSYASLVGVFDATPRVVIAGLVVYLIVQYIDIFIYHTIWTLTTKGRKSTNYLWLRNNGSTIISQFFNAFLFTYFAFYNSSIIPNEALLSVALATFTIYLFISLIDTPFLYFARNIKAGILIDE